jgi:tight adherence protein C
MTLGLMLGCALGASVCLLGYAVVAPRPRLGYAVDRWQRSQDPVFDPHVADSGVDASGSTGRSVITGLADWLISRGLTLPHLRADLAITDRSLSEHVVRKVGYALTGMLLPAGLAAVLVAIGATASPAVPAVVSLLLGAFMFWVPDADLRREASIRRHDLRRALSCFLDLVAMSLAGGRGVPEALPSSARIGTGWAFTLLRDTIDHARYIGVSSWQALAELGARVALPELQDLGGALQLVADDGAKVRASLTARAATQRRRQLAEAEGEAAQADQSIEMAQVVLAIGFFLFLGFPAVVAVMGI